MTQKQKIRTLLLTGKKVSSLDGLKLGIIRVTARIFDLRNDGMNIKFTWQKSNTGASYKEYYL